MSIRKAPVLQGMSDTMVERLQEAADAGADPLPNVPLHGLLFSMHRADLHTAPELAAELALYDPASDAPAPSIGRRPTIAERVACCVSVMTRCHEGFSSQYATGAADTARRRLMEMVMSYPVLLNPALTVEFREWDPDVSGDVVRYWTAVQVIGCAGGWRWPGERDGYTKAQLLDFLRRPGVVRGLGGRPPSRNCVAPDTSALGLALDRDPRRPDLITSLWELGRLLSGPDEARAPFPANNPLLKNVMRSTASPTQPSIAAIAWLSESFSSTWRHAFEGVKVKTDDAASSATADEAHGRPKRGGL